MTNLATIELRYLIGLVCKRIGANPTGSRLSTPREVRLRRGFTLIELLVVIAIIALLVVCQCRVY